MPGHVVGDDEGGGGSTIPKKVEVALFKYAGTMEEPITPEAAKALVEEFCAWLTAESNGKVTFGPVGLTGWQTLPHTIQEYCDMQVPPGSPITAPGLPGQFMSVNTAVQFVMPDADALVPYSRLDGSRGLIVWIYNRGSGANSSQPVINTGCWQGAGNVLSLKLLQHEGGHVLGHLWDAGYWSPISPATGQVGPNLTTPTEGGWFVGRYENIDSMGVPNVADPHYSTYERDKWGWQEAAMIASMSGSGTQDLRRADQVPPTNEPNRVQELRVPVTSPFFYTCEYRPSLGLIVRIVSPAGFGTDIETMLINPGALQVGQSVIDPYRGVTITFDQVVGEYARVAVTRT